MSASCSRTRDRAPDRFGCDAPSPSPSNLGEGWGEGLPLLCGAGEYRERGKSLWAPILKRDPRDGRGAIFITALGIIVILSGLLLAFAQQMRVEALSSANRLAYVKADAIEHAAESWVRAQVETTAPNAVTITQIPAEAIQVGDGYFWILTSNPGSDQNQAFGITDESAKLNLNTVSAAQLQNLPNMTLQIADAIQDWRSPAANASPSGAESSYYQSVAPPLEAYSAKNAPYETVEELLLVRDITAQLLHGADLNQDGVIRAAEQQAGGGLGAEFGNSNFASRGWFNDFTVYSTEPNTSNSGSKRINVNSANTNALKKVLTSAISASRATAILARIQPVPRVPLRFANIGAFYAASGMTATEFGLVVDKLTTSQNATLPGLVNINTAPGEVLMCLNGMTQADAQTLVSQRISSTSTTIAWAFGALSSEKARGISNQITARSFQYSADIVAVSGDGRAFKRVRIVVDAQQAPSKVVYRKELTSLGWPLQPELRNALRSGQSIASAGSNLGVNGLSSGMRR